MHESNFLIPMDIGVLGFNPLNTNKLVDSHLMLLGTRINVMKISRHGASSFHGTSSIHLQKISATWNERDKALEVKSSGVADFNTDSRHNYTISISLDDLAMLFNALGQEGVSKSPRELEGALESELKALNRLLAIASGIGVIAK
jgi:hypothetical protein